METSKTYAGNELALEVAILQLARAVNELTFAVDRLVDKQHREAGDQASEDEYSHILDSLAKAKLQIQKTIDTILDDE
ncbi:MAG: hypothetical protein ACREJ5_16435 [Geminicoccaceae bacterium]